MTRRQKLPIPLPAFACCLGLSVASLAWGQATAAPSTRVVPLVSGSCVAVGKGEAISLDWNPGFDGAEVVDSLSEVSLIFALRPDGVESLHYRPASSLELGGRKASVNAAAIGNGYFHIALSLPRRTPTGTFQLVDAHVRPHVSTASNTEIKMTVSPVREHYCIHVLPRTEADTPADAASGAGK